MGFDEVRDSGLAVDVSEMGDDTFDGLVNYSFATTKK